MTAIEKLIVREFHKLYYNGFREDGEIYRNTSWLGVPALKCPLDLWIYQEILADTRPDLIVETGTFAGGTALYLASICDLLGAGHVVSIDIEAQSRPAHDRITYIQGSSSDPAVVERALNTVAMPERVMVILDSDHSEDHVCRELELFASRVSPGCYLIVEDTNINGHPVRPRLGPGPYEAVQHFLERDERFVIDNRREKFIMTFNPKGYLRRLHASETTDRSSLGLGHWADNVPADPAIAPGASAGGTTNMWESLLAEQEARLAGVNDELNRVGTGFSQALEILAVRDQELAHANSALAKVGAAFSQALQILAARDEQLRYANEELSKVGAAFSQALQILAERDSQIARLTAAPERKDAPS